MKLTTIQINVICKVVDFTDHIAQDLKQTVLSYLPLVFAVLGAFEGSLQTVNYCSSYFHQKPWSSCFKYVDEMKNVVQPVGIKSLLGKTVSLRIASSQNEAIRDYRSFEFNARKFLHSNEEMKDYNSLSVCTTRT